LTPHLGLGWRQALTYIRVRGHALVAHAPHFRIPIPRRHAPRAEQTAFLLSSRTIDRSSNTRKNGSGYACAWEMDCGHQRPVDSGLELMESWAYMGELLVRLEYLSLAEARGYVTLFRRH